MMDPTSLRHYGLAAQEDILRQAAQDRLCRQARRHEADTAPWIFAQRVAGMWRRIIAGHGNRQSGQIDGRRQTPAGTPSVRA